MIKFLTSDQSTTQTKKKKILAGNLKDGRACTCIVVHVFEVRNFFFSFLCWGEEGCMKDGKVYHHHVLI